MSVNLELPTAQVTPSCHTQQKYIETYVFCSKYVGMKINMKWQYTEMHLDLFRRRHDQLSGATPETDFQIMQVAESLYKKFGLKRVFYSAFVKVNEDCNLPTKTDEGPPLLQYRLYQADWLLRYYGFEAGELLSEENPNFNVLLDPKCNWALKHLEYFPVEINKADYHIHFCVYRG